MINAKQDQGERLVNQILQSDLIHNDKVLALARVDIEIGFLYAQGLSTLKPCHLLTPDDLVH